METVPLKNFATWARTALIREVTGRVAAVLAPGSSERIEQARAVAALEKAITAAGGGDKGRAAVADKVAYTWFNRIIALRFMDANGYTGIGVVSPQGSVEGGQPEILAEAKRGVIDTEVVSQSSRTKVAGLLDGTRSSLDPQGEAYAVLLAEYCRHWNRAMPFMFEHEGDFTELLIPAHLLADDSVLNRSVRVLTEAVCQDVEVIGWLYQFYVEERKDEVFAGFKKNRKAGADEIRAATQLFTPHWIVRYLVENSLGRLWMLNRPSSRLVNQMDYYIAPVDAEVGFLKITKPEELVVIDPACGSAHMLTYAFDLLYSIYEEEGYGPADIPGLILTNNLYGAEIDPRAGALAAFALTMKARAKQRTFFNKQVAANICVIDPISFSPDELAFLATVGGDKFAEAAFWNQFADADTFGSLIQPNPALTSRLSRHLENLDDGGDMLKADTIQWANQVVVQAEFLSARYGVVVANPPYMGSRNMSPALVAWLRANYPRSKQDLYACFIERAVALGVRDAQIGMIVGDTWMSISSFAKFRTELLREFDFRSFIHLHDSSNHADIFGANAAFVLSTREVTGSNSPFFSLTVNGVEAKEFLFKRQITGTSATNVFYARTEEMAEVPGAPIAYALPAGARRAFMERPAIGDIAKPRVGMQTSNNAKFLRFWWELDYGALERRRDGRPEWINYLKGGAYRRWWGNLEYVFHYRGDPLYVLGQPNATVLALERADAVKVTWSDVSAAYSARLAPTNTFHDIASHCFYPAEKDALWVLAYSNSRAFRMFLSALNSTVHAQVGDVARIPVLDVDRDALSALASQAVEISKRDFDRSEASANFERLEIVELDVAGSLEERIHGLQADWLSDVERLAKIEAEIDRLADPDCIAIDAAGGDRAVSLDVNPDHVYPNVRDPLVRQERAARDAMVSLISYAVGVIFGRYSLDEPGLILADQDANLQDYFARVPAPTFTPDADNVIPIVEGDWFEDDIVERLRRFLRVAFGEQHFEENLRFITKSLGVNNLRDYFITAAGKSKFFDDHVQRYKKRPIYWLFSSPKGSFNALVYMHRYTTSTASTVLNEYLREFQAKVRASLEHAERSNNAKEADRLRKILLELDAYEHDVLYPLASQNIAIDLDDGVRANYPKFGAALKKIVGLEASE
jgi:hypothetical protein